jgi:hypothetical protein
MTCHTKREAYFQGVSLNLVDMATLGIEEAPKGVQSSSSATALQTSTSCIPHWIISAAQMPMQWADVAQAEKRLE